MSSGEAPRVLVLDTSRTLTGLYQSMLADMGLSVAHAQHERPDFVLVASDALHDEVTKKTVRDWVALGTTSIHLAFEDEPATGLVLRRPFTPSQLRRVLEKAEQGLGGGGLTRHDHSAPRVLVSHDLRSDLDTHARSSPEPHSSPDAEEGESQPGSETMRATDTEPVLTRTEVIVPPRGFLHSEEGDVLRERVRACLGAIVRTCSYAEASEDRERILDEGAEQLLGLMVGNTAGESGEES